MVKYYYDAWGNQKIEVLDSNCETLANLNPFRYRSYYYDTETGLYYLNSRYYDPETGRFISQDSIEYADPQTINGLNLYAYCSNNPVMYVDYSGHNKIDINKIIADAVKSAFESIIKVTVGATISAIGFTTAFATVFPALFSTKATKVFTDSLAIGMYGGFMAASVFNSEINADMERINWNMFNDDAEKVLESKHVSFYKGVPVVRYDGSRSGTFGIMFLRKTDANGDPIGVNEVKHEYGHYPQLLKLGIFKFGLTVGLPSVQKWGVPKHWKYYKAPWEAMADIYGGAAGANSLTPEEKRRAENYFIASYFLGPLVLPFYSKF